MNGIKNLHLLYGDFKEEAVMKTRVARNVNGNRGRVQTKSNLWQCPKCCQAWDADGRLGTDWPNKACLPVKVCRECRKGEL